MRSDAHSKIIKLITLFILAAIAVFFIVYGIRYAVYSTELSFSIS